AKSLHYSTKGVAGRESLPWGFLFHLGCSLRQIPSPSCVVGAGRELASYALIIYVPLQGDLEGPGIGDDFDFFLLKFFLALVAQKNEGVGGRGAPTLDRGNHVGAAEPMSLRQIGRGKTRRGLRMGVVKPE